MLKPQVSSYLCESQVTLYVHTINLCKHHRGITGESALPPSCVCVSSGNVVGDRQRVLNTSLAALLLSTL